MDDTFILGRIHERGYVDDMLDQVLREGDIADFVCGDDQQDAGRMHGRNDRKTKKEAELKV